MRITKISVKGLFGMFDHEIPLNQDSRITIVHGPNGVGKTVLMEMVHGFFHYDYDWIMNTLFHFFRIHFDGGESILIENNSAAHDVEGESSIIVCFEDNSGSSFDPLQIPIEGMLSLADAVKESHGYLIPVIAPYEKTTRYWLSDKSDIGFKFTYGEYTGEDILREDPMIHEVVYGTAPDWFKDVHRLSDAKLISVMRNKSDTFGTRLLGSWLWNKEDFEKTGAYLVPSLPDALEEVASKLKSNKSLLRQFSSMEQLSKEEEDLSDALDSDELKNNQTVQNLLEAKLRSATEKKEAILDDNEYRAGKLLFDLINQRLLFKHLQVDEEEGIRIYADGGAEVPLATLSSGEKQLCILYYRLLFDVEPDTLVMIDEPELSMNVVWQRNFLKDLQRIIELRNFDVLIATHSPQIIHDKWDWMVALGEKMDG